MFKIDSMSPLVVMLILSLIGFSESSHFDNSPLKILNHDQFHSNITDAEPDYIYPDHLFETMKFPSFMSIETRQKGGIVVHIMILIYGCLTLALICDSHFVPVLEKIGKTFNIPTDISGATLMAVGTSAPELFASSIGVFITVSDIGTGTILGSAVFNLVCVPAVCGIFVYIWRSDSIPLQAFPIVRDSTFYLMTIIFLYVSMKDEYIDLVESSFMLLFFAIYIFIMYLNARIVASINALKLINEGNIKLDQQLKNHQLNAVQIDDSMALKFDEKTPLIKSLKQNEIDDIEGNFMTFKKIDSEIESSTASDGDDDEDWISNNRYLKYILLPVRIIFMITVPPPKSYWTVLTFIISSIWIGLFTYLCIWMVTIIGNTFGMSDTLAGLTIMAAGTSVPEIVANVIVIKKRGAANMAMSNAIGSNIFDVLIGLGLPWFLRTLINFITGLDDRMYIKSADLPYTVLVLFAVVLALVFTLKLSNWRLGLKVGVMCAIIYITFITVSVIVI